MERGSENISPVGRKIRRRNLTPLRGWSFLTDITTGWRPWLHSYAATRLKTNQSDPLQKIEAFIAAGNKAIQEGSLQKILSEANERLRPEAAYFFAENGFRTALYIIDVKEPSDIPVIAEPFFIGLNAAVQFTPVMNADDVKKALDRIGKK